MCEVYRSAMRPGKLVQEPSRGWTKQKYNSKIMLGP